MTARSDFSAGKPDDSLTEGQQPDNDSYKLLDTLYKLITL